VIYAVRAYFGTSTPILHKEFKYRRDAEELFLDVQTTALSAIIFVYENDFFYNPDRLEAFVLKKYGHTQLKVGKVINASHFKSHIVMIY
jgi:methionine salvage enolase-phosphatase E1